MDTERLRAALEFIERETHLRTKSYRMLSDGIQGGFLQAFSLMIRPETVLEIGTFTGYATLCLARGLREGGRIDTIEKDDELTDIYTRAFAIAGASDSIRPVKADALEALPGLSGPYDIVYIDADKRLYHRFYDMVFDKVRPGGYILADNVLWSGKTALESPPSDKQTAAIMDFNSTVAADPRTECVIIPVRDGLAVIHKKETAPKNRIFSPASFGMSE